MCTNLQRDDDIGDWTLLWASWCFMYNTEGAIHFGERKWTLGFPFRKLHRLKWMGKQLQLATRKNFNLWWYISNVVLKLQLCHIQMHFISYITGMLLQPSPSSLTFYALLLRYLWKCYSIFPCRFSSFLHTPVTACIRCMQLNESLSSPQPMQKDHENRRASVAIS